MKTYLTSKKWLEFRRKAFHLVSGVVLVALLYYGIIGARILFLAVIAGFILSVILKYAKNNIVSYLLNLFERDEERESERGRGAITFTIGVFLAVVFFENNITYASLLILAFGDAIAPLLGKHLGVTPHPHNPEKKLEGVIAGALAGGVAASIFVPFWAAMAASFFAMCAEAIVPKQTGWARWVADDNMLIPLAAGIVLTTIL